MPQPTVNASLVATELCLDLLENRVLLVSHTPHLPKLPEQLPELTLDLQQIAPRGNPQRAKHLVSQPPNKPGH